VIVRRSPASTRSRSDRVEFRNSREATSAMRQA
jgi:hypothetical protein